MASRMIGKRAKILGPAHVEDLLFFAQHTRHPVRNRVIVLLSVKAGLRAAEIAHLIWEMVIDPSGEIATTLELQDRVAKKGSGRVIPIHRELREALTRLREQTGDTNGPVIESERGASPRLADPDRVRQWRSGSYGRRTCPCTRTHPCRGRCGQLAKSFGCQSWVGYTINMFKFE